MAFTKITGDPLNVLNSGWQQIATATASNSATIDFDSGIDFTAFTVYAVVFTELHPGSDNAAFRIRVSEDGGSTYEADASEYSYSGSGMQGGTIISNAATSTYADFINGETVGQGNDTGEFAAGIIYFFNLASATVRSQWSGHYAWTTTSTSSGQGVSAGMQNTEVANDGIRLFFGIGNIESGEFKLYGVA